MKAVNEQQFLNIIDVLGNITSKELWDYYWPRYCEDKIKEPFGEWLMSDLFEGPIADANYCKGFYCNKCVFGIASGSKEIDSEDCDTYLYKTLLNARTPSQFWQYHQELLKEIYAVWQRYKKQDNDNKIF